MAKVETRKSKYRTDLASVIPLRTPYVLFVDPSSACNFQCTFCPTGDRKLMRDIGRFQGNLTQQDFEKVIADCTEFDDKIKVLRLYKDGEPLLNKNLFSMIALAKKSGRFNEVDTTSNGFLLTPKNSEMLVDSGLDLLNISVDGMSKKQFFEFTKVNVDFKKFVDQIKYLNSIRGDMSVVIKTTSEIIGEDQHTHFYDTFGPFCDKIFVENTAPCWPDFDVEERMGISIKDGLYGNKIKDQTACPYIFYSISVNSDMKVSACFVDWSRELILGDLRNASLKAIWNSNILNSHRYNHISGNRKNHQVCGKCRQLSHCGPDSIEGGLKKIKLKMDSSNFIKNGDILPCGYE